MKTWQNPLSVNLIRSITQGADEGYYDDFDFREIMSTPISSRSYAQTRIVYAYLRLSDQYGSESVPGMLSEILHTKYFKMNAWERLDARKAEAMRLLDVGDRTDVLVHITWNGEIEATNIDRINAKNPTQPLKIDYHDERSFIASLIKSGLLDLWERRDSFILRGTRLARLERMSDCQGCIFAHRDAHGSYCAATYQPRTQPAPSDCQDYSKKQFLHVKDGGAAYVRVTASDIMVFPWLDEAVWEIDIRRSDANNAVQTANK